MSLEYEPTSTVCCSGFREQGAANRGYLVTKWFQVWGSPERNHASIVFAASVRPCFPRQVRSQNLSSRILEASAKGLGVLSKGFRGFKGCGVEGGGWMVEGAWCRRISHAMFRA